MNIKRKKQIQFFVPILIFLLIVFGFESQEQYLILLLVIFGIVYTVVGYGTRKFLPRFSIHHARPYRNLDLIEKEELKKYIDSGKSARGISIDDIRHAMLISSIFGLVVSVIVIGLNIQIVEERFTLMTIMSAMVISVILQLIYHVRFQGIANDVNSPLSMIQGSVIQSFEDKRNFDYKVGRYDFRFNATNPAFSQLAKDLKQGDMVTVEFSPKSRYVSKIIKMNRN